jgi:hypothetical protein
MKPQLTVSALHAMILAHLITEGFAPDIARMAAYFGVDDQDEIRRRLIELEDYHGVVLHPNKAGVWVIHPFSTAPTNFSVHTEHKTYWGNCAWCSLGAAALLQPRDVRIETRIGAEFRAATIQVTEGKVSPGNLLVHFPVPMAKAWENVLYTCSVMLVFEDVPQIESWCERHGIVKGDVQPINTVWQFAKDWYGKHLSKDWKKWTMDEAIAMFRTHNLTGPTWELAKSERRF